MMCVHDTPHNDCIMCEDYTINIHTGKCDPTLPRVENCKMHGSKIPPICKMCDWGFGMSENRHSCDKCKVENCASCNLDVNHCDACYGMRMVSHNEQECLDNIESGDENCLISMTRQFENENHCSYCKDGYTISSEGKCIKDVTKNCWGNEGP